MNKFYTALLALTAVAMMVPASAEDCVYTTSNPEVTIDDGGASGERIKYVDNDLCQPDCFFSIWIYEESNGIDGLQRDDEVVTDFPDCFRDEEGVGLGPNKGYIYNGVELFGDTIIF